MIVAYVLVFLPLVLALYSYAGYPLLLRAMARAADPDSARTRGTPLVTAVVPAYNEQAQIAGAVDALLAQDYPRERLQILVVSDASTDGTDDIVSAYASRGVELLRMPARCGKTAAENAAVTAVRGEIVVNTDASARLHESAVRCLVESLADPKVGVASTRDISVSRRETANRAEAGYVGYEMFVRSLETRADGIVGASGSGYAIRAELHRLPVRNDLSRDFSAALTAHRFGYRAVSVNDAICFVPRTGSLRHEYRRKVRTISRGMDTLYFNRDLANPALHGWFAVKLLSHKVSRWLTPISLLPATVALAVVATRHPWIWIGLGAWTALLMVAIAATQWGDSWRIPRWLPLGTVVANLSVIHAAWRFVNGHHDHIWEPTRRPDAAHAMGEQT